MYKLKETIYKSVIIIFAVGLLYNLIAWEFTGAGSFAYQVILNGKETATSAGLQVQDFEIEHFHIQFTQMLRDNLTVVVGPCIAHHALYSLRYAYLEWELIKTDYETILGLELGRYIVPFGIFNRLAEVTVIPTITRPMVYASHDQDFIGLHDYPQPLFMSQYTEIGININGLKWFGQHSFSYSLFAGNGLFHKGYAGHVHHEHGAEEQEPVDIEWLMEQKFVSDNNKDKMFGGRISYGFSDFFTIGFSGMYGKYDPEAELSYFPLGIDIQIKLFNLQLKGEFVQYKIEFKAKNIADSTLIKDEYTNQAYYILALLPLGKFETVFMYDFLQRKGPEVETGFFDPDEPDITTSIKKYSFGINYQINDYVKFKSEFAVFDFSEEEDKDVQRFSLGTVISF